MIEFNGKDFIDRIEKQYLKTNTILIEYEDFKTLLSIIHTQEDIINMLNKRRNKNE